MKIAIFAPKLAALETPNVEGEASPFRRHACMSNPLNAKPAPTTMAPKVRGRRIPRTMRIVPASPLPNKAFQEERKPTPEDPMPSEIKKRRTRIDKVIRRTKSFLPWLFRLSRAMLFVHVSMRSIIA